MYEVELKFPLSDGAAFVRRLGEIGAKPGLSADQCDLYFNHPDRDFERTDEALRIRTINGRHRVTYKGPVLDPQIKTRHEIEIGLEGDDACERFSEMLRLLGFRPVREVRKHRQTWHLTWHEREFEIAVDEVSGLGLFAEIETLAEEAGRSSASAAILSLVAEFQLPAPQRRSYLALLLAKDGQNR
jgi:adenylate cyclase class 2